MGIQVWHLNGIQNTFNYARTMANCVNVYFNGQTQLAGQNYYCYIVHEKL